MIPWIAKAARDIALQSMPHNERIARMSDGLEPTEVPSSHARAFFYWAAARINDAKPRCETCKYWGRFEDDGAHECERVHKMDATGMFSDGNDRILTTSHFGCTQYEEKQ